MSSIDLNADMGESFGPWQKGADARLLEVVTSANIACGFHAGDPLVMARTVRAAHARGVNIGAHPGFPDLRGFGRRRPAILDPDELGADILYQIGALAAIARAEGASLAHVKLHGALSNIASEDRAVADTAMEAIARGAPGLAVVALAGTALEAAARAAGLPVVAELFADRGYRPDGTLVPRGEPGAMIDDPKAAAERVLRMVEDRAITAVDGSRLPVEPDTICVHGDGPTAIAIAEAVRARLEGAGIRVAPFRTRN
ncbi:MAG: LamB/YcsF family protein [Alphaproteobacteria bacterium]|nr:MAG: LamB/YcsF family protein [Alphaproteobacteria bacterium]